MIQAFVIVLREGFEAFLIVAITAAYLQRTGRRSLMSAVWWGIAFSVVLSALLGYLLVRGANEPLWEGVTGLVSAVLVAGFVIHMWRTAPRLQSDMETRLREKIAAPSTKAAFWGVFVFTTLMIAREGMETALLLIQVPEGRILGGAALGTLAATAMALLWWKLGRLLNLKLFFQVTAVFLLLFVAQVLIYSFHEFSEAGLFPNSEALHAATEPYGPDGIYGKWISLGMVAVCAVWLAVAGIRNFFSKQKAGART